jgi:hypothetical protein
MATFSPTDAALEGFRLTREKPRVLLAWSVANLFISVIMALSLIAMFGPMLAELEAVNANSDDPSQALAVFEKLAPLYALVLPAGLIVIAVWSAAVYRAVLRPADNRFWYLRLGADELRLALLMLIYVVLAIGFTFVLTLVAGLLSAGALAIGGPVGALISAIIGLVGIGVFIWVAVRLSLSGPATFAERHIRVFESWILTRGVFWRLLGAYVLSLALVIVVMLLALVIYAAIAAVMLGGDLSQIGKVFQPDTSSLTSYFTPAMLIYLVFGAFLGALQNAVIYAPPAVAFRELHGPVED